MMPANKNEGPANLKEFKQALQQQFLDWPELTERDYRRLLRDMRLDVKDIKRGKLGSLKDLLSRAVAKAQRLSSHTQTLDPSILPKCQTNKDSKLAFFFCATVGEVMSAELEGYDHDAFLEYRIRLARFADTYYHTRCKYLYMQDDDISVSILLVVRGVRLLKEGAPLLEVQVLPMYKGWCPPSLRGLIKEAMSSGVVLKCERLDVMFMREVLAQNTARLAPEYRQRCMREWSDDGTPFDVSFLMPMTYLDPDQIDSLQARCANGACGRPASAHCSRCQDVKYCSRNCQTAHWPHHKAQCSKASKSTPTTATTAAQHAAASDENSDDNAAGPSVIVPLRDGFTDAGLSDNADGDWELSPITRQHIARLQKARHERNKHYPPNMHGNNRFVVKLVVHFSPDSFADFAFKIQVEDQQRSFQTYLDSKQPAFKPVVAAIRKGTWDHRLPMGCINTMYMYAKRISDNALRIMLEQKPEKIPSW
ncbi:hypothetical protein WJX73_002268 [Symbiochloris irregularis]|uniref:MYND-type domain-containing protein n=1 Tax=Symbiochloris irregularis TaxID=706552 RepID=A0AAW1PUC7_9CHLO